MGIGSKLSEAKTRLNVLSYGDPGSGKTTGGLQLTKRGGVLLIDAEAGAKKEALATQGVDVSLVETWPPDDKGPDYITYDTLETDVFEPLLAGGIRDYPGGVVIDSMTELTRRLLDDVVVDAREKAARLGKNRDRWFIDIADYGTVSSQVRSILRRFRDLNTNLVMTALQRRDTDNDGAVSYGPALSPAISNDVQGLVDIVCYNKVELIGDKPFYVGTLAPVGLHKAKDRFGVLPVRMIDPTAERMLAYVEGTLTKAKDPRQKAARDALAEALKEDAPAAPVEPTPSEPTGEPDAA